MKTTLRTRTELKTLPGLSIVQNSLEKKKNKTKETNKNNTKQYKTKDTKPGKNLDFRWVFLCSRGSLWSLVGVLPVCLGKFTFLLTYLFLNCEFKLVCPSIIQKWIIVVQTNQTEEYSTRSPCGPGTPGEPCAP